MIFIGEMAASNQVRHCLHGFVDVFEEQLVSLAQVIQPGFAVGSQDEPVARTFAVTRDIRRIAKQQAPAQSAEMPVWTLLKSDESFARPWS